MRRPNVLAALLFLALALFFFGHVLLPPLGQVLAGHDMLAYYHIAWDAVREGLRQGQLVLWEPNIFGGYPFLVQPQQNTFYPPNWVNVLVPTRVGVTLHMAFHVWLAGFGMFLFTRRLGARPLPAVLGGLGFAYGGLLAGRLWAGHSPVYAVFIWTPLMLAALDWAIDNGRRWAAVLAGAPFGLAILAGHIPSFLYVGLIWAAFVLYLMLTQPRPTRVAALSGVAGLVGMALAAVQLVPFMQFTFVSGRVATADYAFATDYSLPPAHLVTLLTPEFFGEPLRVGYWSVPTFEELTYYAGIVAVLGIALALRRPNRLTWFYVLLAVVGLALALGRYGVLYELAYRYLPPFRLVRAPGRAAFLFLFAASALLAHTLSQWRAVPAVERRRVLRRYWPAAVGVMAVALVAALAATGAVFMAVHPTDTSGRLWHQIGGWALALVGVGIGGALLWAYLMGDSRFEIGDRETGDERGVERGSFHPSSFILHPSRRWLVGFALVALIVADTWFYSYKMARLASSAPDPVWTDGLAAVGPTEGRVIPWGVPLFSQNGAIQVGWPSVFGYDSLEPAAHIALASSVPDPRSTAYDILGASHVLAGGPLDDYTAGDRPLTLVGQQGAAWVYERARVLPLARLVHEVEVIADGAAAIDRIHAPDFEPGRTAILAETPDCPLASPTAAGSATIEAHEPTHWRIGTQSDTPALLVLAENAYPGWQATIDGNPAETLTAYTTVRAVCVPAGEHMVEWTFAPRVYWVGAGVSLLALALILVAWRMTTRSRSL